jgi:hypothetical protein
MVIYPESPVVLAVLSLDVLDVSGTNENDASFARGFDIHKIRLDSQGRQIGKAEYLTPQSQVRGRYHEAYGNPVNVLPIPIKV